MLIGFTAFGDMLKQFENKEIFWAIMAMLVAIICAHIFVIQLKKLKTADENDNRIFPWQRK